MSKTKTIAKSKLSINLDETKQASLVLRALNHKTRQAILNFIEEKKETRVTDIYKKLKLEQSLASSYLALLRRAQVVKTRRDGQVIYYSVDHQRLAEVTKGAKMINS